MTNINVAIDGPAGAGKSTISRQCAKRLGFVYIDTGAMYRACALYAIENKIKICSESLSGELDKIKIDIRYAEDGQRIYLCGKDVSKRIREADVSIAASDIAVVPEVRLKLVDLQRELARGNNVIMDGRDIGTYVLPDADVKIFLTASLDERAKRRYEELIAKNTPQPLREVKRDMSYRDKNDSQREFAPLRQAEDAVLLDTTELDFETAVERVLDIINTKRKELNKGVL